MTKQNRLTERFQLRDARYEKAKLDYLQSNKTFKAINIEHKIDPTKFNKYLASNGIQVRKKIDSCDTIFDTIDSEEKSYWLGFLYADGSITYKESYPTGYRVELALKLDDLEHLKKFKAFLNSKRTIEYKEKTKAVKITISSKKLCAALISLGCTPKKSLTLIFPTENQVPNNLLRHFVRGYFDGDGSLTINKITGCLQQCSVISTSEFLTSILQTVNMNCNLKKDKRHLGNTFYIRFSSVEAMKFLNYIYENSNVHLDRKYNKYAFAVQHRNMLNYKRAISVKGEILNTEIS